MHRRTAKVLRRVFDSVFVLLLVLFAHALVRTNLIAARAPSAARITLSGAAARQVVHRFRIVPTNPNGRVVILDGVKYPWTDSGFSAALIAAGSNATLLIPQNAVVTLTSDHTLAFDSLTVRCEPGAEFISGVDQVNLITITGTGDEITGCDFSGGSFPDSNPLFLWNSRGTRIEDNVASGFVGVSTAFVYLVGAQSSVIRGNQCTVARGGASCIFGEKNALSTTVQDNDLDESTGGVDAHDITFHSTNPGTSVSGTQILDNRMLGGRGFCVEIGAFGGEPAQGFVISGNTCKMNARGLGGYSVGSAATFWSVANNTFDANGFVPEISCLEVAGASDGILLGNSCNGGNISLSNSQAQRITITSNVVYNFRPIANAGIYVGTAITSGQMNDNLVTSNLIHLPSGVATIGIWQQCLATEATCDRNTYDHNTIVSDGTPGTIGIKFENDRGTSADETLGSNSFRTPHDSVITQGLVTFTSSASAPTAALPAKSYPRFLPQGVKNDVRLSR
jgi:hypothetical protein